MTAVSPLGPSTLPDETFEDLYEQYSSRVFGYCLKWLRSREEAEDAVQTTFLYAMRGLRRGVVPRFDEAWLLAIARNVCRNRTEVTRRRAVEVTRSPQLLEETVAAPTRSDDLAGLSEALGGLTEQQRRAILLREWQGLSYREIADELDLSQSAVETLLFRARRALAARLGGAGSFVPWLKSFAGGGAGSLAVGATVVAVTAAGAIGDGQPDRPARHIAPATQPAVHRLWTTERRPPNRTKATPPPRRRPSVGQAHVLVRAAVQPPVPATATTTATATATASGSAVAPTGSTVSTPNPAPGPTQTVPDATKPVTDPAGNTVETVVASATDATSTVGSAAPDAIAAATDAVASAAATVSTSVPALPTVTVGDVVPSVPPLLTP